jgi:hypothetical protein
MKKVAFCLLLLLFISSCGLLESKDSNSEQKDSVAVTLPIQQNQPTTSSLNGKVFQYLPSSDIIENLFTLVFNTKNDSLTGIFFGSVLENHDGVHYFKSNLDSITLKNNTISFSFIEKDCYTKPFTLENYNDNSFVNTIQGGSSNRIFYKGYFHGDTLTFILNSEHGKGYIDTMNFIEKHK